jgi:methyl-accepting chemotaxis protein
MFKNMRLAAKIGVGFGLLIVLAVLLGGIATYCMLSVKNTTVQLSAGNMPSVVLANNVERSALNTMYQARGYIYSDEEQFLDKARASLAEAKKNIVDSQKHAETNNMAVLKQNADKALLGIDGYEKQLNDTVAHTKAMQDEFATLVKIAGGYMAACNEYQASQAKSLGAVSQKLAAMKAGGIDQTTIDAVAKEVQSYERQAVLADKVVATIYGIRIGVWKAVATRNPKVLEEGLKAFDDVAVTLNDLKKLTTSEADIQRIDAMVAAGKSYQTTAGLYLETWQGKEALNVTRGAEATKVLDLAKTMATNGTDDTSTAANAAASSLSLASVIMIVGLCVAVVLGIGIAVVITRSITKPIGRIITGLTEGAEQVASAAGQVSAASQSLAEGATEQAAGLEETSSSLEEMSAMTKQNADNAQQANVLAGETRKAAKNGNEAMTRMSKAITDIQKSSDETAKIIKVIDEIAFQTNLLALNAAVEAARAGEAGKGFAVVAEEVRNLAMRSAEAAKNTSAMIEESVKNSKNGVDIANEVGKVLTEIVASIGKTTDLVAEIAAASQEQARGVDQVNTAVGQMDKVTQQNAANAEESASASEELSAQAGSMKGIVNELAVLIGGSGVHTSEAKNANAAGHVSHKMRSLQERLVSHKAPTRKTSNSPVAAGARAAKSAIPLDDDNKELDAFNN